MHIADEGRQHRPQCSHELRNFVGSILSDLGRDATFSREGPDGPPKEKCELKLKKHEKVRGEVLCFLFVYLILVESHTSHVSQSFFGTFTIIYIHLPF